MTSPNFSQLICTYQPQAVVSEDRLWPSNPSPAGGEDESGSGTLSLGVFFKVTTNISGTIKGAYIYCRSGLASTINLTLSESDTSLNPWSVLRTESISVPGSGWQRFNFATPVSISQTSTNMFQIWYHQAAAGGAFHYAYTGAYFSPTDSVVTSGNLQTIAADDIVAAGGSGQGQFVYNPADASERPVTAFNSTNYWIDPIFQAS